MSNYSTLPAPAPANTTGDILEAIEVAYNHGYKPASGPIDEYGDVFSVLGREPTQEEAQLLGEARSEGFKKRMTEKFNANRR